MRIKILFFLLFVLVLGWAVLDQQPVAYSQEAPTPSAYTDLLDTEIRGISSETIEAYRNGEGNGIALPAELNGYPGPRHVLDLGEHLALTDDQRDQIQVLYDEMMPEAIALGEQILDAEEELELAFRENTIDEAFLQDHLNEIGALEAALRFAHLRTHIATTDILTSEQIEHYNVLRGYATENKGHGHNH